MRRLVGKLLWRMLSTMLTATLLVFVAIEISIKGGYRAVVLPNGDRGSPRDRAIIDAFHLDDNVIVRYGYWLADVVRGDFGRSQQAGEAVGGIITHRLPISIELMIAGMGLALLLGVPLGLLAAARSHRGKGGLVNGFLGLAQSVPVFITPLFLVWLFSIELKWFPAAGWTRISNSISGNLEGLVLPATALAFAETGVVARIIKRDVTDVLQLDYIAAALGKGLSSSYVLLRHALRPASLGLLNVIGINIGSLLSGALVIELIFGIGGLGQVLLEATLDRDLYLLLGLTVYTVGIYVLLNAMVDVAMHFLNPAMANSTAGRP